MAQKCRRVLWFVLSTPTACTRFHHHFSIEEGLADKLWKTELQYLTAYYPEFPHFWHTQGQCNEALPLRYLTPQEASLDCWWRQAYSCASVHLHPPQESLLPLTKLTQQKAVWIHSKPLRQNPTHFIAIWWTKQNFILHTQSSSPILPHLTTVIENLQLHWDQCLWGFTGISGHGFSKDKVLRESVP